MNLSNDILLTVSESTLFHDSQQTNEQTNNKQQRSSGLAIIEQGRRKFLLKHTNAQNTVSSS
jgi:hypothetical protein